MSEGVQAATLDGLPAMMFLADACGRVTYINRRLRERTGRGRRDAADVWNACLEPDDRDAWDAAVRAARPCVLDVRLRGADGVRRAALLAAEPAAGAAGTVEWFGTFTDVDERQRLDDVRQTFVSLAENSSDFFGIATLAGSVYFVNDAGRTLLDMEPSATETQLLDYFVPTDLPYVRDVIMPALERDGRYSGDFRLRNFRTGAPVDVRFTLFYVLHPVSRAPIAIATVSPDIRERAHGERRLRTLIESGAVLSHSLDYEETLRGLADLVVRTVATFCLVDVFDAEPENGAPIDRIAVAHADRERLPLVRGLLGFVPDLSNAAHPVVRAYVEGASSLVAQTNDEWIESIGVSAEHAGIFRAMGMRSVITVPLVASGEILGALTCGLGDEAFSGVTRPETYGAEDLFFLEELGRRAGAAIDNARRYERERKIAVSLQEASLPRTLPQVDGFYLDADYRPGKAEATIGGDWYDAFALEDGRIVLTIGDVLGKGLRAAIAMTKVRQAMQAAAMVEAEPNVMLDVADKTLRIHDPNAYATAIAAIFDPRTHTMRFASAGHPAPMCKAADGTIEECGAPGLLLGLRTGDDRAVSVLPTPPGSAIVFFTDGLTEATRNIDEGERRLQHAVARADLATPHSARGLVETVLAGKEATDDIAVLIARIRAEPR